MPYRKTTVILPMNIPMQDNIQESALPLLAKGISKIASVVGSTMGPKGKNVLLEHKLLPFHRLTNDGATIIQSIELTDPIEKLGATFLKEAAERSNGNSGDGSSTTTVLLNAILEEGIKTGISTLEIKESLDACLPTIEASIHAQTREITVKDIPAVARIAGEDEELAQLLGEIYNTIGKEGIIHLEGSGTFESSYSLIEGVRFIDTGYLSPYMATDGKKAVYEKPKILVTKNKIAHLKDIDPILQALIAQGEKSLVIFTDDMDSSVARTLIELQKNPQRSINILIIKAPTLWKGYVFEDFAKITGATIIEDASGTALGNKFRLDWLGTCDTLIVDKEETTVIGIKDIADHTKELTEEGSTDSKRRLSWLTTKTAILKLGAKSDTELSYRMLKAEDAIFSSRLALNCGVVAGGGSCLLMVSREMPDSVGGNILKSALERPFRQIMANAGIIYGEVNFNGIQGINASTGEAVDMFEAGIVDAASIVLNAVKNSLGIASTLLTTSSVILLPEEKQAPQASPFPFN